MAGETLFRRRVKVILAAPLKVDLSTVSALITEIDRLRVSFRVQKSLTKDPNTCELKIYNLSEQSRNAMPGTAAKVVLHAGYETTEEIIFVGDARTIESKPEGPDWVTTIRCGDGERAVNFARINESFAGGAKVAEVIRRIGKATKLDNGNIEAIASSIPTSQQYTQGYAAYGSAIKELERALKVAGYELSIQDGALLALKPGETTTEEVIELNQSSGLIGSPEFATGEKKEGANKAASKPVLKAKSLLQGQLRCGRRVKIVSRQYNGLFKIVKVEHSGDTAGGDFYSSLEMEAQ